MKSKKNSAFTEWVKNVGVEKVAKLLKTTPRSVRYWLVGHCHPRVDQIRTIQKISKLSYNDIIDRAVITKGEKS